MRLWRISDFPDLSGGGGAIVSGRWHSLGRKIIYMSDHPASALVEMLVHFEIRLDDIPNMYQLLAIDLPDESGFATVDITDLPSDWRKKFDVTQTIGDRWLGEKRAALLRVPSAIVPAAFNWLLNPSHADAGQARVAEIIRVTLDPRLLRAD